MLPPFLRSRILSSIGWIDHGFGTRTTPPQDLLATTVKQIHSNLVLRADSITGCIGDGDALVTDRVGTAIAIRTADCYPILLADARNRSVAAVHAGWRGTAGHILAHTLKKMRASFATEPRDVVAAIGPGIGTCCYEVGVDVARQFGMDARTHLDLMLEDRKQLVAAGVPLENIEALDVCTFCDTERFFSYRREKDQAGRMISFIRIVPEIKPR